MGTSRSIPDLLDLATSADIVVAGSACRELLHRSTECNNHINGLIDLLDNSSVVIRDLAFRTIERIGQPAVDSLVERFDKSDGEFRRLLLWLISGISRFDVYFPILESEIHNGDLECRYWAANCLGRNYTADANWPPEAIKLLDDATQILVSLRNQPEHWAQARMTLKHLGRLPNV